MYLYEIVSDLELRKQGINIDKFVIHKSMKQARELVADNIKSPLVTTNHLLGMEYDIDNFTQPAILNEIGWQSRDFSHGKDSPSIL